MLRDRQNLPPRRRVMLHGQKVTEQDWRGILAVLTTVCYYLVASIATIRYDFTLALVTISVLSTPEMLVLNWYFRAKEMAR